MDYIFGGDAGDPREAGTWAVKRPVAQSTLMAAERRRVAASLRFKARVPPRDKKHFLHSGMSSVWLPFPCQTILWRHSREDIPFLASFLTLLGDVISLATISK
jgi:hypothetical protein